MKREEKQHLFTRVRLDGAGSNPFEPPGPGWALHSWQLFSPRKEAGVADDICERTHAILLWEK